MLPNRQFALTHNEMEQFRRDGFLGPFTAFQPEEMNAFRETVCNRVLATPRPDTSADRGRHGDSETIWRLCSAPAIVERMASLYGPDLVLWLSTIFYKPPARDDRLEEFPWHQDVVFWNLEPSISLCAWIAITPATVENGCVEVIPGSHKRIHPTITTTDPKFAAHFHGLSADPAGIDESKKVQLVLKPGEFFLFNERTLHHSGPNRSHEPRIGLGYRVTLPMVKSYHNSPVIMLRGQDRFGFNTYTAPPIGEPDITNWPGGIPDCRNFTFDRPVPGLGWYPPEHYDGLPFRWTGPETDSWVALRVTGNGGRRFRCRLLHSSCQEAIDGLRISVNGADLSVARRPWRAGVEIEADVPSRLLSGRDNLIRLTLSAGKTARFSAVNTASSDNRLVGLAVHEIDFEPDPSCI
jgi:hypothetical protein